VITKLTVNGEISAYSPKELGFGYYFLLKFFFSFERWCRRGLWNILASKDLVLMLSKWNTFLSWESTKDPFIFLLGASQIIWFLLILYYESQKKDLIANSLYFYWIWAKKHWIRRRRIEAL